MTTSFIRLDRMIAEFREAQTRRYPKPANKVIESNLDSTTTTPLVDRAHATTR